MRKRDIRDTDLGLLANFFLTLFQLSIIELYATFGTKTQFDQGLLLGTVFFIHKIHFVARELIRQFAGLIAASELAVAAEDLFLRVFHLHASR